MGVMRMCITLVVCNIAMTMNGYTATEKSAPYTSGMSGGTTNKAPTVAPT